MQELCGSVKLSVMTKFKADLMKIIYHKQKEELLSDEIGAVRSSLINTFESYLDEVKRRSISLISMEISQDS